MKFQNVYEVENLDFEATYENLCSNLPSVVRIRAGRKSKVGVGSISFRLRPAEIEVQIFPKGPPHKIQVAWTNDKEKEVYLPKLKDLLVPVEGREVALTPLHMNILKVSYPGPVRFILAWCKEKINYIRKIGLWDYLRWRKIHSEQKRDREIRKLMAEMYYGEEMLGMSKREYSTKKDFDVRKQWYERFGVWPETDEK